MTPDVTYSTSDVCVVYIWNIFNKARLLLCIGFQRAYCVNNSYALKIELLCEFFIVYISMEVLLRTISVLKTVRCNVVYIISHF